ncbi:hypothetical protein B0H11DRAFT_2201955 [Mycena galericulata]|nr:hypothetical protein B0H11DRAFT_2201955 [Mycena galericulata]
MRDFLLSASHSSDLTVTFLGAVCSVNRDSKSPVAPWTFRAANAPADVLSAASLQGSCYTKLLKTKARPLMVDRKSRGGCGQQDGWKKQGTATLLSTPVTRRTKLSVLRVNGLQGRAFVSTCVVKTPSYIDVQSSSDNKCKEKRISYVAASSVFRVGPGLKARGLGRAWAGLGRRKSQARPNHRA